MTKETLAELVEAHQAELFRYLRFIGADFSTAEDVLQETYMRAFRAKAVPDLSNFPSRIAWLRRIAHNLFIDHCRRNQRSPINFSSEAADTAESHWKREFIRHDEGFGRLEALERCLNGLNERQRELIDSFYGARRTRDEIASALGVSPDGVKIALRRVRKTLSQCIQKRLAQV